MRLLAPAKINLHLRVGPLRGDGFHPLLSWMVTVGLFDTLTLQKQDGDRAPVGNISRSAVRAITLECDLPGLPCDERNLVVRIAQAWREYASSQPAARPVEMAPINATLAKRIPMGGGLGGGSSDGARALLGLNALWQTNVGANDLSAFASRFGSDLPFFFHGPSSVCQGRGELVTPVTRPAAQWAVLVLPRRSMPTPDVYRQFDRMHLGNERDISNQPDWRHWAILGSEDFLANLVNDLEPAAFAIAPELGELRTRIEQSLGRIVRMSGSGSSLFTLFDREAEARLAAEQIERNFGEQALAAEVCPNLQDDLNANLG